MPNRIQFRLFATDSEKLNNTENTQMNINP